MIERFSTSPLQSPEAAPVPEFEYKLLVGHARTDGTLKSSKQLRTEYVQLTDELIHKITDGIEVEDPQTHEHSVEKPDVVVWVDKSARPVAWLTKELWPLMAADENGEVPKRPDFKFVNIDRQQWVNRIDPTGEGYTDIGHLDPSIIRSLRSVFTAPKYKETTGLSAAIDDAPTELDGKTTLIVDEVRSSGRTLDYSVNFFKKAFPKTKVAGTYWMGGVVMKDGAVGNADLPVWYKEDTMHGRWVGDRDDLLARQSLSLTQRLGASFLSNRLKQPDVKSAQLRQEIHHLSEDARQGEMLIIPSIGRENDDFDQRAQRLNNMDLGTFINAVKKFKSMENTPPSTPSI